MTFNFLASCHITFVCHVIFMHNVALFSTNDMSSYIPLEVSPDMLRYVCFFPRLYNPPHGLYNHLRICLWIIVV
jgi:hypothetical protein